MSIETINVPQHQQQQQQVFPTGTTPLETQVAGHVYKPGTNLIGMLKDKTDGSVLKPLGKPICGAREIAFYESLQNSTNDDLKILQNFVPTYLGTVKMELNQNQLDFIKLNDLTTEIIEPCIMDIKIGKRTWDPLATPEKIADEQQKYAECKQNLGLCIPGFQVNLITQNNGIDVIQTKRFGREYGKQLNVKTFVDSIRLFLNGDIGLCRQLILDILSQLRPILMWCRTQTSITFYSSSILIIYDARRLKNYLFNEKLKTNPDAFITHKNGSNLHYDLKSNIPSYVNNKLKTFTISNGIDDKLKLSNGTLNGHIQETQKVKCALIEQKNGQNNPNSNYFQVHVKMIDFAHAFPTLDQSIDTNYLYGIENLVKIFDQLLEESAKTTK